jgi:AcrR family transcriptional regulator
MTQPAAGLRQRQKQRTAQSLWETAIGLFLKHGFENVTVAQIAEAVEVSRMTVYNYFPTKEDLALRPIEDHIGEAARTVRERPPGQSPVEALRHAFLTGLDARDAATGLSDAPHVLAVRRLLDETPTLADRALRLTARDRALLAAELTEPGRHDNPDVLARVKAAQLIGLREELVAENVRRLLAGESADTVYPDARAAAQAAFDLTAHGLLGSGR